MFTNVTYYMYSANNSNTFLAYYNQIDKYLSYILWLQKYVPYHERVTMVIRWKFVITHFVNRFESKLRYFWDLRNQLVHWFRLDNKHYLIVSDHALKEISSIHDELIKPQTIADMFEGKISFASSSDWLEAVLEGMKKKWLKYLPIYDNKDFKWVLSFQDILARLVQEKIVDISDLKISDVDITFSKEYIFVTWKTSIYEMQNIFADTKDVEIVLVTPNWEEDEKIIAIVSVHDLAHLQEKYLRLDAKV